MGRWKEETKVVGWLMRLVLVIILAVANGTTSAYGEGAKRTNVNAYATMMYMGTPRDYEFYVAIRVMLRSLARFNVEADRVVIASLDVPDRWVQAL
ncbi:hypothetical protein SLA2020_382510 [Shorea laevis]